MENTQLVALDRMKELQLAVILPSGIMTILRHLFIFHGIVGEKLATLFVLKYILFAKFDNFTKTSWQKGQTYAKPSYHSYLIQHSH